jgi:hypothetical protein
MRTPCLHDYRGKTRLEEPIKNSFQSSQTQQTTEGILDACCDDLEEDILGFVQSECTPPPSKRQRCNRESFALQTIDIDQIMSNQYPPCPEEIPMWVSIADMEMVMQLEKAL